MNLSRLFRNQQPWVLPGLLVAFTLAASALCGWWLAKLVAPDATWAPADLRALDPADIPDPAADITAVYARAAGLRCRVRVDMLDLPEEPRYDLAISLGGRNIRAQTGGPPLPQGVSLAYDPLRETIVLELDGCIPGADDLLSVRSYGADASVPLDELRTGFAAVPPGRQARVRLAFYNVFSPAATPAQALRRWDGAHTGPRGERHGLHSLLDAAEKYGLALTLFDLKTPAALAALDYLGGLPQLRRMERSGLLELPAAVEAEPREVALALSRAAAQEFGLLPGGDPYDAAAQAFDLPADPDDRGLPLDARRRLQQAALSGAMLTMGGDFQRTTWGTPEYINRAFAYLAARPYLHFETIPAPAGALRAAPLPAVLERLAFDARAARAAADPALAANYTVVEDRLRDAAAWLQAPRAGAACVVDETCALSSGSLYAVLAPRGARLVLLFSGQDQVVGPTAQFFIGFSDRTLWDLSRGEAADPAQVPGAFADSDDVLRVYTPDVLDGTTIRFRSADGRVKTYRLVDGGLEVTLSGPVETRIPLVLRPQARFAAGWAGRYTLERAPDGLSLGLVSGPTVRITAAGASELSAESPLDARALLLSPEDPDREYPPGVHLPFALTLVRVLSAADVVVRMTVR